MNIEDCKKYYMKKELKYQVRLHNIKQESNEVARRNSQLEQIIIVLKEDNVCLS